MLTEHHYEVHRNTPYDTWHIKEKWGGVVRSPFTTAEEAIEREELIADVHGFLETLYLDNADTYKDEG